MVSIKRQGVRQKGLVANLNRLNNRCKVEETGEITASETSVASQGSDANVEEGAQQREGANDRNVMAKKWCNDKEMNVSKSEIKTENKKSDLNTDKSGDSAENGAEVGTRVGCKEDTSADGDKHVKPDAESVKEDNGKEITDKQIHHGNETEQDGGKVEKDENKKNNNQGDQDIDSSDTDSSDSDDEHHMLSISQEIWRFRNTSGMCLFFIAILLVQYW